MARGIFPHCNAAQSRAALFSGIDAMPKYVAVIEDTKYPLGYIKWLEAKRIDAIRRRILATGKAWQGLELPSRILPGRYFRAYYDGYRITIHKYRD